MKKICKVLFFIFCIFLSGIYAYAEDIPEIYNRGKKVELQYDLIYHNEEYFIHSYDLEKLDISYTYDEVSNRYKMTTNDCLGVERSLYFAFSKQNDFTIMGPSDDYTIIGPGNVIIISPVDPGYDDVVDGDMFTIDKYGNIVSLFSTTSEDIKNRTMSVTFSKRSSKELGGSYYSGNTEIGEGFPENIKIVEVNENYYYPVAYIGEKLSHKYRFSNNRFDFYTANQNGVIIENTVNICGVAAKSADGWPMNIYFAEKTGESDELSDFNILHQVNYTISPEEKKVQLLIDIPKESITDECFYYILDLGEEYNILKNEYDFSEVGNIVAFANLKYSSFTIKINLPETDKKDVAFTIGVEAGGKYFEKSGIIKSGEISETLIVTHVPAASYYYPYVLFDENKYVDAYVDKIWLTGEAAADFTCEYTANKSKEIKCNISLPDGFNCKENVELTLALSPYITQGTSIGEENRLKNGNDAMDLILNKENPSAEIILYGNSNELKLSYALKNKVNGLTEKGGLGTNGWFVPKKNQYYKNFEKITGNKEFTFSLLENIQIIITEQNGSFVFEKTNEKRDVLCDIYIAYYDENDTMMFVEKKNFSDKSSDSFSYDISDRKIKKIKAFVWEHSSFKTLGESAEIDLINHFFAE